MTAQSSRHKRDVKGHKISVSRRKCICIIYSCWNCS